ncbi:MAG: hydrolase 1, exosortase A system-associated, partial [Kiloniellaceae bacterium]
LNPCVAGETCDEANGACIISANCSTSTPTWQNTPIAGQSGIFTVKFDAIPSNTNMDGLVTLSVGPSATFSDAAVLVRFNQSGNIDARNGGSYAAAATIPYTPGQTYHFRADIDVPAHVYNVYVTPNGASEQTLATAFAFRSEQGGVTSLDHWGLWGGIGSHQVCNFVLLVCQVDSDGDGINDCDDGCPNDVNKTAPGICGCGVPDTGDSDGDFVGFEGIGEDIAAAMEALTARVPEVREAVLWGLCDGASAAAFHAARQPRVGGLVLVNPWARSEATVAEARVKHYYARRLLAGEFWRKLLSGKLNPARALGGFLANLRTARGGGNGDPGEAEGAGDLPERVGRAIADYTGPVLVVLSGADLTAQEFDQAVLRSPARGVWAARANVTVRRLDGANHTYSTKTWRSQVHAWTLEWLAAGSDSGA